MKYICLLSKKKFSNGIFKSFFKVYLILLYFVIHKKTKKYLKEIVLMYKRKDSDYILFLFNVLKD